MCAPAAPGPASGLGAGREGRVQHFVWQSVPCPAFALLAAASRVSLQSRVRSRVSSDVKEEGLRTGGWVRFFFSQLDKKL